MLGCSAEYIHDMKHNETTIAKKWRQTRGVAILAELESLIPGAGMVLQFHNDWELLVAVELSAQCTDKQVNKVTPRRSSNGSSSRPASIATRRRTSLLRLEW